MISIVLSLLIMLALMTILVNVNHNNNEMARTNYQIENGRFATQLLQNDLSHAGFWGAFVPAFDDLTLSGAPSDTPSSIPDPCLTYNAGNWTNAYITDLIGIAVDGYDAAPTGCTSLVTNQKTDTDILVVRHAETCLPGVGNCDNDTNGKLYFQASLCEAEIDSPMPYSLSTNADGVSLMTKACDPAVVVGKRQFISNLYYIRNYAITPGDDIPTLMRSKFDYSASTGVLEHQAAVPVVEGIEGFKIEFGIDNLSDVGTAVDYTAPVIWGDTTNLNSPTNRGDGIPDTYISCTTASPCSVADLTNAVAVKLYILSRSREISPGYTDNKTYHLGTTTLGPYNDNYKRQMFSTTVRLVNVSGRRETPNAP